jgi:hypothetical protein
VVTLVSFSQFVECLTLWIPAPSLSSIEDSLREKEGSRMGDVMCVATKTGVSVPHVVSNHPLICLRPSAWHCTVSVITYGSSQDARYVEARN